MFKNLLLIAALALSPMVYAQDAATEAAKAAKAATTTTVVEAPATAPAASRKTSVGKVAEELSDALTMTAKKLNVELQDFAKSPLGIFTMALIVFKLAGTEINMYISAFTFLFCMGIPWLWWTRRTFGEFNEKNKLVKLNYWNGKDFPGGALFAFTSAIIIIGVFAVKLP